MRSCEQREEVHEETGRVLCDVDMSQRMPGTARSLKRQGRILPPELQREHGTADTVILDFWLPEI